MLLDESKAPLSWVKSLVWNWVSMSIFVSSAYKGECPKLDYLDSSCLVLKLYEIIQNFNSITIIINN